MSRDPSTPKIRDSKRTGIVQTIFPIGDGSAVKITTARYFTPKGRDINAVGIEPEIKSVLGKDQKIRRGDIAQDPQRGDIAQDPQLVAAVNFINGRIAQAGSH